MALGVLLSFRRRAVWSDWSQQSNSLELKVLLTIIQLPRLKSLLEVKKD